MSKGRLPGTQRKTRRSSVVERSKLTSEFHRFIGVSLSGGKADKACIAVVEFYPEHNKIFLARLYEKVKNDPPTLSADQQIVQIISQYEGQTESVAFDAPLQLPKCIRCVERCVGYEVCTEPEMKWLRHHYEKLNKNKKPKRFFTPYTQRCAETYLAKELEEPFEIHHALGSNMAPLTARAIYLKKHLAKMKCIEVNPKLSIWRLGLKLKVAKSHLRFHKHSVGGDESRRVFLSAMVDRTGVFLYQQDQRAMVENNHAFEAFIGAYTGFLSYQGQTQPRPQDFPKEEAWVEFPL